MPSITDVTAAHLHQGAPTAAGPIILPLYTPPAGTLANTLSLSGTSSQADLSGALAADFAGFVAALKAGDIYVNVHTVLNPPGEIRGNVVLAQAAPAPGPASSGSGGFLGSSGSSALSILAGVAALAVVGAAFAMPRLRRRIDR